MTINTIKLLFVLLLYFPGLTISLIYYYSSPDGGVARDLPASIAYLATSISALAFTIGVSFQIERKKYFLYAARGALLMLSIHSIVMILIQIYANPAPTVDLRATIIFALASLIFIVSTVNLFFFFANRSKDEA